jgi:hypothetical protein
MTTRAQDVTGNLKWEDAPPAGKIVSVIYDGASLRSASPPTRLRWLWFTAATMERGVRGADVGLGRDQRAGAGGVPAHHECGWGVHPVAFGRLPRAHLRLHSFLRGGGRLPVSVYDWAENPAMVIFRFTATWTTDTTEKHFNN